MSEKTKKIFQEDLKIFYNVFTGNQGLPPDITKFSDIKLRDYHKMDRCKGPDPLFDKKYKGPLTNKLFNDYAENLKKMIQTANKNQQALLTIINKIFVYTIDPQTGKKQIRVNPSLTEQSLQEIVVETRALIIKLYLSCEIDYVNGLKMYEAIVEQKILETAQSQINSLEKMSDQLITEDKVPVPAEVQEIKENTEEKINEKKEEIEKQVNDIKKDEEKIEEVEVNPPQEEIKEEVKIEVDVPPVVIQPESKI
jgi:hypothetical protein